MAVVLPIVVPVLERDELDRLIVHIRREALLGHRVELVRLQILWLCAPFVLSIFHKQLLCILTLILLTVVNKGHQIVWVTRLARNEVYEEPSVLWLLKIEMNHLVQVRHSGLQFERHLLHAFEDISKDTTLVGFFGADLGTEPVDCGAFGLQTPGRVESHQ